MCKVLSTTNAVMGNAPPGDHAPRAVLLSVMGNAPRNLIIAGVCKTACV